ncbi:E4 protein, partial [Phocoena phocoena papillomavirus 4]
LTLNLLLAQPIPRPPRVPVPRSPYLDLLGHIPRTPPQQHAPPTCPRLQRRGNPGRQPLPRADKDPIRKRLWDSDDSENKENIPPLQQQGPYTVDFPPIGPLDPPVTVTLTVTFQ